MKLRVLIFGSVLVVSIVGLYLTSPRDQRSNPPMANINSPGDPVKEMRLERLTNLGTADNNATPVTTDKSQNTDENPSNEDCLVSGKPFHAGNIKIISVNRNKGDDSFAHLQIAKPRTPQETGFNQYVLKFIARSP